MNKPVRVLFVCTANICRSPAAEYLARSRIGEDDFVFRSAGFLFDGRPITEKMEETIRTLGVDGAEQHQSHIVDDDTLEAADLVLTMESRHLRDIAVRDRSYFAKTIPFREIAERLRQPMTVAEFLASIEDRDASDYFTDRWDVEDPYRRSAKRYLEAAIAIEALVRKTFSNLTP